MGDGGGGVGEGGEVVVVGGAVGGSEVGRPGQGHGDGQDGEQGEADGVDPADLAAAAGVVGVGEGHMGECRGWTKQAATGRERKHGGQKEAGMSRASRAAASSAPVLPLLPSRGLWRVAACGRACPSTSPERERRGSPAPSVSAGGASAIGPALTLRAQRG